jgi:hypothetical protein
MAIELATIDHRGALLEMKAATRARIGNAGESTLEVASGLYEGCGLQIRYLVKNRAAFAQGPRRHGAWKGRWYVGWKPVGENQLFGILRNLENGTDRLLPTWVKTAAYGGGYTGLGEAIQAPAVHRAGADVDAAMAADQRAEGDPGPSPVPDGDDGD